MASNMAMASALSRFMIGILVALGGLMTGPRTAVVTLPENLPSVSQAAMQTGIINTIFSSLILTHAPTGTLTGTPASSTTFASAAATTAANAKASANAAIASRLPIVIIKPKIASSTTSSTASAATAQKKVAAPAATAKATSTKSAAATTAQTATTQTVAAPTSPAAPAALNMTALQVLANATTSLVTRLGGQLTLMFKVTSGNKTVLTWTFGDTPIINANGAPQFDAAYTCDPPPDPLFGVRTNYTCSISITPLSGTDRRTQSKQFTFTTGPGTLSAMQPSSMSTHLVNDENDGGFSFANQDTEPVTITSETFDIYFAGLTTVYGPLVLRLVDPKDPTNHLDYHLENTPADPTAQFTYNAPGVTLSFPFTVGASNQKLLPIQILGVHKLSVVGVNPTIKITLRGITTDRSDIKITPGTPSIAWSCVVTLATYDPNATSGPFATGEACLQ